MGPRLCLLKTPSRPLLLPLCINLYLYRHPPLPGPHQTCQIESSHLLHQTSTPNTPAAPRLSRSQDTCPRMIYRAHGTTSLPSSTPEDLLPLVARRATRAISHTLDQKAQQGFRQARKRPHWRRSGVSCLMKKAIRRKDLANFFVGWQCTLYVDPTGPANLKFQEVTDFALQIEDYEPSHSIVITPTKMVKYYDDVKLSNELYPWPSTLDRRSCGIT